MLYKTDIRWDDGTLTHRTSTPSRAAAEAAYRELLACTDFEGKKCAARLVSPHTGKSIYFSHFDKAFGQGRIHPDAPLDLERADDGSQQASAWLPPATFAAMPNTQNFNADLRSWMEANNLTAATAAEALATTKDSVENWLQGRSRPRQETAIRALAASKATSNR
jgi:DNA-binding transcriptional regulator YiaG